MKKISFLLVFLFLIFCTYSQNKPDTKKKDSENEVRITLNLKDTDIKTFLQAIAEAAKVNIIPGPEVDAKVTARLKNIPWKKALSVLTYAES